MYIRGIMKRLTKAEEQIMQILWDINQGFVKDIIENLPDPIRVPVSFSPNIAAQTEPIHLIAIVVLGGEALGPRERSLRYTIGMLDAESLLGGVTCGKCV